MHAHSKTNKRQRAEKLQLKETPEAALKRQRTGCEGSWRTPAAYWDNASKVWFTKRTLKEFDRRTFQARQKSRPRAACRGVHRPVTRSCTFDLRRLHRTLAYTVDPLDGYEPQIAKKIKLYARQGGPDLSEFRNYSQHPSLLVAKISSSRLNFHSRRLESTETRNTMGTGPYDEQFEQVLVDNSIYPHGYKDPFGNKLPKPDNRDAILQMLGQRRPSLSVSRFTDEYFEEFVQANVDATRELHIFDSVVPYIEGSIVDRKCRLGGVSFTNLDDIADIGLTYANPGVCYGARPEQLNRVVRNALAGHIKPSSQDGLPIAPNFFLETKGPKGSPAVARRQACYHGALGARGMHSLLTFTQGYDNNAHTISGIYQEGQLQIYACHVGPPRTSRGRPEMYMTLINAYSMMGSAEGFRAGATAYRNARDWAKVQRDAAILQANEWSNGRLEDAAPTRTKVAA